MSIQMLKKYMYLYLYIHVYIYTCVLLYLFLLISSVTVKLPKQSALPFFAAWPGGRCCPHNTRLVAAPWPPCWGRHMAVPKCDRIHLGCEIDTFTWPRPRDAKGQCFHHHQEETYLRSWPRDGRATCTMQCCATLLQVVQLWVPSWRSQIWSSMELPSSSTYVVNVELQQKGPSFQILSPE